MGAVDVVEREGGCARRQVDEVERKGERSVSPSKADMRKARPDATEDPGCEIGVTGCEKESRMWNRGPGCDLGSRMWNRSVPDVE